MTTHFYQYWHKWIFYKRLLIAFFALNVLSVSASAILTISYWSDLSKSPTQVKELIIIGALTMTFGILLPTYIFYQMTNMAKQIRNELANAAREIAKEWMQQFEKYDQEPFRNVDFWANAVLLSAEQMGRYYNHPLAQFSGEMAGLVRTEINKIRRKPTA